MDRSRPVVHLELHTGDLDRARAFYAEVCGWRPERVTAAGAAGSQLPPGQGGPPRGRGPPGGPGGWGGGIVECAPERPVWLPYVEVPEVHAATERALGLGAAVLLEPREGPAGWRSVGAAPAGGEIAFWQHKR